MNELKRILRIALLSLATYGTIEGTIHYCQNKHFKYLSTWFMTLICYGIFNALDDDKFDTPAKK